MSQPEPAGPAHTFVPRRSEARTESLVAALVAAGLVVAILYSRGEDDWRMIAGFAALGAALILLGYVVRSRFQWVDEIHLDPDAVTLISNGRPQTLPWTAVKSVRHFARGGEHWILSTERGHLPMTIRADGLNRDEARQLRELIPALHAAARPAE